MKFIEDYIFLIVGVMLVAIWIVIILVVYRHIKSAQSTKVEKFWDVFFLWPIVVKNYSEKKTANSFARILVMLVVLVVCSCVLVYVGKYAGTG